ncbi:MAG: SusC/RagA family TonB-linked outer membrane protein [Cytophagales bacterium]|nr:SusC/RagA family TonB-linked outer membrane protein [Cytophagales bacterium]
MKNKLLRLLFMVSRYAIFGFALQAMFLTVAIAYSSEAQAIKSVKEHRAEFHFNNTALKDVLNDIEGKTDYRFTFYSADLDHNITFSLDRQTLSIADLLIQLSEDYNLAFKQVNNNITIRRLQQKRKANKPKLEIVIQGRTITGKVTSEEDQSGLPGVNVLIKGTGQGTVTDVEGNFAIDVADENAILVFSYVGYVVEEVAVGNQSVIDISLVPDLTALDEIVVIGYGTQKKSDLTGAVTTLDGEAFKNDAIQSSSLALQGRVAGVRVVNNGGRPGAGATIRIRGTTTRNNNEPLIVIDGQIVDSGLGFLNPNDIESMTVLKDASAAAIYGSRAAAGVILITTKRGIEGKPEIEFSTYYTFDKLTNKLDMLNTEEYMQVNTEWFTNAGLTPSFVTPDVVADTDWQDEIFRTGSQQNYHLSIRGGNDRFLYGIQGGYFHQEGLIKNSSLDRYNFRFNNDLKVNDKLKLTSSIDVSYAKGNQTSDGDVVTRALQYPPNVAAADANGDLVFSGYTLEHPLVILENNRPIDDNLRALGNLLLEYEFIEGLKLKSFLGLEYQTTGLTDFRPKVSYPQDPAQVNETPFARLTKQPTKRFIWSWDNLLSYSRSFGDHNMSVMIGHTAQSSIYEFYQLQARDFMSNHPNLHVIDATLAPDEVTGNNNISEWALASVIGRLTYDYKNKYLFSASFRQDRSSRIHPDYRDAFFPSFSGGWVMSEESFFNVDFIDRLKIRGGWGQIGNERSGDDYPYQATVAVGAPNTRASWYRDSDGANAIFGGVIHTGAVFNRIVNKALKWETTTTKNIALDLAMFGNSVLLTTDFFIKDTEGIITVPPMPAYFGLPASYQNESNIRNTGIEIEFTYRKEFGEFSFEISPNYTYIKNEIITLSEAEDAVDASIGKSRVGRPYSTHSIGWIADGIFQNQAEVDAHAFQQTGTAPGDIRYKDLNGDNVIDEKDRDWIGVEVAPHNYGVSIIMEYKNFDLNLLGVGQMGGETRWNPGFSYHNMKRPYEITGGFIRNRWHGEGTSNSLPRLVSGDPNNNERFSTLYLESSDYFRIQNIQLGYNFSNEILNKLKLSRLRFYVAGQNLFTITNFNGYDPQTGYGGYPVPASVYFGLNVSF